MYTKDALTIVRKRIQILNDRLIKLRTYQLLLISDPKAEVDMHVFNFALPSEGVFLNGRLTNPDCIGEELWLDSMPTVNHQLIRLVLTNLIEQCASQYKEMGELYEKIRAEFYTPTTHAGDTQPAAAAAAKRE